MAAPALDLRAATRQLEMVIRDRLPRLNEEAQHGDRSVSELATALQPAVNDLVFVGLAAEGRAIAQQERERAMVALGFVTGAVERHAQTAGQAPGCGISAFPDYERLLRVLAGTDLPSRDTARTFWLCNRRLHGDELLTYTSDRGERFFNQQVCEVNGVLDEANGLIRDVIGADRIKLGDADALSGLPTLVRRYKAAYSEFRRKDADGPPITPSYFMSTFRTYLPTVPVAGEMWHGPNAAWLATVFSFDALLGTARPWYRRYALDKSRYLTEDERNTVVADFDGLSVMDLLGRVLRLPAGLGSTPATHLAERLVDAPAPVLDVCRAIRDSWLEIVKGTKSHELLVRDFLDRPSSQLDEAGIARMAVKPTEGTGGGTRNLLADIGQMRKSSIAGQALVNALRLVDGDGAGAAAA